MPTQNNDVLRQTSANQTINAGGGDDTLYWVPTLGNATFNGGDTNERYDPNPYMDRTGGDSLIIDSKSLGVKVNFTTTEDGSAIRGTSKLVFTGIERMHLGDGNDTIIASAAKIEAAHGGTPAHGLTIYSGGGNDSIVGTSMGDILDGGAGNDTIRAGAGDDFVQSSTGNDRIYGDAGNDNIRWGQGNFQEVVGNDVIYGGAGHDLINVWIKDGWTENGPGVEVDILRVMADGRTSGIAETTIGGAKSTLKYFEMEQTWTHEGRDTIDGSKTQIDGKIGFHANGRWGDDRLIGSKGNDTLEGGEGRDTITGGRGNDLISANGDFYSNSAPGDRDVDTIIFNRGDGHDTVLAFDIGIDAIQSNMSYRQSHVSGGTLLTFDSGDTILLANAHDFI